MLSSGEEAWTFAILTMFAFKDCPNLPDTDGTKEPDDPIDDILFRDMLIIPKFEYEDGLDKFESSSTRHTKSVAIFPELFAIFVRRRPEFSSF